MTETKARPIKHTPEHDAGIALSIATLLVHARGAELGLQRLTELVGRKWANKINAHSSQIRRLRAGPVSRYFTAGAYLPKLTELLASIIEAKLLSVRLVVLIEATNTEVLGTDGHATYRALVRQQQELSARIKRMLLDMTREARALNRTVNDLHSRDEQQRQQELAQAQQEQRSQAETELSAAAQPLLGLVDKFLSE
jgi:hypothetical protein